MSTSVYMVEQRIADLKNQMGSPRSVAGTPEYASFLPDFQDAHNGEVSQALAEGTLGNVKNRDVPENKMTEKKEKYKSMGLKVRSTSRVNSPSLSERRSPQRMMEPLPALLSPTLPPVYDPLGPASLEPPRMISPTLPSAFAAPEIVINPPPMISPTLPELFHSASERSVNGKSLIVKLRLPREKVEVLLKRQNPNKRPLEVAGVVTKRRKLDEGMKVLLPRDHASSPLPQTPNVEQQSASAPLTPTPMRYKLSEQSEPTESSPAPVAMNEAQAAKSSPNKEEEVRHHKEAYDKYISLGRSLKHRSDRELAMQPKASSLYGTESVMCYMIAFDRQDRLRRLQGQKPGTDHWTTLPPFTNVIIQRHKDHSSDALAGTCQQLLAVVYTRMQAIQMERLRGMGAATNPPPEDSSSVDFISEFGKLCKYQVRMLSAWHASRALLPTHVAESSFPETWEKMKRMDKGGNSLPLLQWPGVDTTVAEVVEVGRSICSEWASNAKLTDFTSSL